METIDMVKFVWFVRAHTGKVKSFNMGFFDENDAYLNAFHRAMQFETGGLYDPTNPRCIDGSDRDMCGRSGGEDDRGGNTKYGIAQNAHPHLDIDALTLADAKRIYKQGYWDSVHAGELSPKLGYVMFNIACGSGPRVAVILLQRVLGLKEDGKIGPITLSNAKAKGDSIVKDLLEAQKRFYESIGRNKPSQQKFVRGWKIRADGFAAKQILDDIDADYATGGLALAFDYNLSSISATVAV